jgi:hypothetical protein
MVEEYLMEHKGMSYWEAHNIALKHENDSYKKIQRMMRV